MHMRGVAALGAGNNKCKGPEAGDCRAGWINYKEAFWSMKGKWKERATPRADWAGPFA